MKNNAWQPEFNDLLKEVEGVFEFGMQKHGDVSFLEPDGAKCSRKDSYAAASRHLAQAYWSNPADPETGRPHIAHLMCNLFMWYTREKRGIRHPMDVEDDT